MVFDNTGNHGTEIWSEDVLHHSPNASGRGDLVSNNYKPNLVNISHRKWYAIGNEIFSFINVKDHIVYRIYGYVWRGILNIEISISIVNYRINQGVWPVPISKLYWRHMSDMGSQITANSIDLSALFALCEVPSKKRPFLQNVRNLSYNCNLRCNGLACWWSQHIVYWFRNENCHLTHVVKYGYLAHSYSAA